MSKGVKSARGQVVDFDLLKIKQQIASAPKPTQVQVREDFIDQKFKRRLKRLNTEAAAAAVANQSAADVDLLPEEVDQDQDEE
jgi:hypothetical protein